MSLHPDLTAPEWAPRLSQADIRELYEQDARGRVENAAVNAIGTLLLARCESLLAADAAVRGKAECPQCGCVIEHDSRGDERLVCSGCSWAGTWGAYRQSLKGQNLRLGNLRPVVGHFVGHFAHCGTARERLIQIDFLLHQFQSKGDRPGEVFATSLLEGKEEDVEQFLETLEYGERSTSELVRMRAHYREGLSQRETVRKKEKEKARQIRRDQKDIVRRRADAVEAVGPPAPTPTPRVPQKVIARLYDLDAKGIYDEDLLDEVGCHLLARIESIMVVTRTYHGQVKCPLCPKVVEANLLSEGPIACDCGWVSTGFAIREFYKGRRLTAGGMEPYYKEFLSSFPHARGYRAKMILVDQLIHRFHDFMAQREDVMTRSRAGAANLIEGKAWEVNDFLNGLTYGDNSTAGLAAVRQVWRDRLGRDRQEDGNGR